MSFVLKIAIKLLRANNKDELWIDCLIDIMYFLIMLKTLTTWLRKKYVRNTILKKVLGSAGIWTRDLLHPKQESYP